MKTNHAHDFTQENERRAEKDRRRQHYGDQARIAQLEEALRECITETPGAACYNTGKKTRRLEAINEIARAALNT